MWKMKKVSKRSGGKQKGQQIKNPRKINAKCVVLAGRERERGDKQVKTTPPHGVWRMDMPSRALVSTTPKRHT